MSESRTTAPESLPVLPHTWRPLGPRVVGVVLTLALTAVSVSAAISFGAETRAKFTIFQRGTLVFFALLALTLMYALIRSRVQARREGLLVVNGYRRREIAWAEVVAVRLPPGAPWATLDLADGTTVAVMGIQGSDGERARRAVRQLRRLSTDLS